jgi:hypothetical protein
MSITSQRRDVDQAIRKLKSLHESELGIVEVVACGESALPSLRALLFQREPSGLFQARCRAVNALDALGAFDVLIEYLSVEYPAVDPIEKLGDDAVVNCAARAVAKTRDDRVFALLLRLAKRPFLSGVIGALGAFGRVEAIPALVAALEEDVSRKVAEFMLRRMKGSARAALLASANQRLPSPHRESESSLRRRRSSLVLLAEIGISPRTWPQVRGLLRDDDVKIAMFTCKLCLLHASPDERSNAITRLASLLPSADWVLRGEIENCLATASSLARPPLPAYEVLH